MRIRATRPVTGAGKERKPGEVFDASQDEAQRLVWLGWAEKADEERATDEAVKGESRR